MIVIVHKSDSILHSFSAVFKQTVMRKIQNLVEFIKLAIYQHR